MPDVRNAAVIRVSRVPNVKTSARSHVVTTACAERR
ncbi:hypothetical protein BKA14_003040 [Actinoplanes abujensis]|uniref:Uncharacterized protein n=1 Tax=Paractinoplanes abujensis TaxID=882441 RepID=A0A7W7CQL3_9ACTN|nr:hypothetical protein [Actinoplanes abujensis]